MKALFTDINVVATKNFTEISKVWSFSILSSNIKILLIVVISVRDESLSVGVLYVIFVFLHKYRNNSDFISLFSGFNVPGKTPKETVVLLPAEGERHLFLLWMFIVFVCGF